MFSTNSCASLNLIVVLIPQPVHIPPLFTPAYLPLKFVTRSFHVAACVRMNRAVPIEFYHAFHDASCSLLRFNS